MRIFTFPFGGGNRYSYNFLKQYLDIKKFEWINFEYPGRGKRIKEPFLFDIDDIVEDMFQQVKNEILKVGSDYLIFGHSMGALSGYLICHLIVRSGLPIPKGLIISGMTGPSFAKREKISHLPSNEFWAEIQTYGGLPREFTSQHGVRAFFEPVFRADLTAIESYKYRKQLPLNFSIDVFYGDKEKIDKEEVLGWEKESTNQVTINKLDGGHFFIYNHAKYIIDYIVEKYT
ncbi:thioesterase II family protein [Yeosuana marina]|uniref:thioesterase II family protein n=1 Tax=Yeosuana marina TaxID=1565536 RepID=UPI0030C7B52F